MLTLSTPERLALLKLAKATAPMQPSSTLSPIEPVDRSLPLPLSLAQQRLWLVEQLGGADAARHIHTSLTLKGTLDRPALVRALNRIVARHETLRTTFSLADGQPAQRIAPVEQSCFHLVVHDLTRDEERDRLIAEEMRAGFDLERGPLVRGRLISRAQDDHLLLVSMHHIVSDGWSLEVFTRELRALYGASLRGAPDPLPDLPVQYADYAAWQRRSLSGDARQQQADYWTETLSGAPELLELPTDHARPTRQNRAGAVVGVELDDALTDGLKALSLRHGTTLFMSILAGWAAVLGRLAGQDDVVIGTPTAGRGRQEIEGLIGFFVNSLPIRIELPATLTVSTLLARVKERVVRAQHHQDIPFDQVVELMQPARSPSHHPIFQVMFAWQHTPQANKKMQPALPVQAEFDLSLWLMEADGRIVGSMTYATALFERETVERYVGYLRQTLAAMVADDQQRVDRLRLLSERERLQLIEGCNRTETVYPTASCVHDLFEAQVAETPDAVAVTFADRSLTYAELNAHANRLAHHLIARGVTPDARVVLYLERSLEMVIGLLAVLKAGGAYVPLDPADPVERLATMIADCAPVVVLTQVALAERLGGVAVPIVALDAEPGPWDTQSAMNPARAGLTPDHLAYIIYTSGSTGLPKGVMNAHRGVVNRLRWMQDAYAISAGDAVLQKTPYSFDVSVWEFFWTLGVGARLVVARPQGHKDPTYLATLIRDEGITTIHFVPSMLQRFLDSSEAATCTSLTRIVCSGEALPAALMSRVHTRLPGAALINLYGPTEAAVDVTAWPCERGATTVSLGRPIANTQIYVLDGQLEPVPVGVSGELFIGGVQVARGYRNRPALTAERFVPDPFGGVGARLYATGDRVRYLRDGTLEYVGRNDFQAKIRGFRIELGEIETRLAAHPAVREAVVLAREDTPGERRLVAYVVGDETAGADVLRAHLSETLPDYMVPAAYVRLGALPLTRNGKVDRRALPAPDHHAYARRGHEPPLGETEEALALIWTEVLGIERVGRTDNFFELGGHSLLAVQVLARVREELAVNVPTGGVFAWPRLADFARELTSPSQVDLPAIQPVAREGAIPLSYPQTRLWDLERHAGVGARRASLRVRMKGDLDRAALIAALEGIVARHEALRTTVVEVDGVPEQRIAPATSRFRLVENDLRGAVHGQAELTRVLIEEVRAPFDLAQGPLIRGRLIRIDNDEHVLVITMHPIIADGWSTEIFAKELTALYAALHRGEPDLLPPQSLQYGDYALWQRRCVAGESLKSQAQYWKNTLSDAPEILALPTDHPRPAQPDYAGARVAVELDATQTEALRALARRHRVTMFMALLAGWGIVLHRLSGQDDVVIGSPTTNRRRREVQGIIGPFENTLALRLNLSGNPTVANLLAQVKARTVEAHHHQDLPFEEVGALVQAMFAWRNAPTPAIALPGLAIAPVTKLESPVVPESVSPATARFDLTLSLTERDERIVGSLTYATALFERATVERHARSLRFVLEAMSANDHLTVDALYSQNPLFFVHDGTGSTDDARLLEPYIGDGIPVFALPSSSSSAKPPARTVEEMATRLVKMIHEIRPHGPYRVAGRSFGGVLAYEMATQLLGEDEAVELVGLFDPERPGRAYIPQPIPAPVHLFGQQHADGAFRTIEKTSVAVGEPSVLKLQGGKRGVAPLLCVPGAGTSITSFIDLIAVLDPSWPIYGLQPRGMDGVTLPHSTVAAAARYNLRAIEETWPDGPIHLLGHSFGGWIAFEMAIRLRASGRPIGSLTILDSEIPETDARSYDIDSATAFLKLVEVVELSAERSFGITRADVDARDERGRLKLLHQKMVQYGLLNARATDESVLYGASRVFARCIRTVYRPSGRYPDPVRLVLVNDPREDEAGKRGQVSTVVQGWKQWAPALVLSTATGNHVTTLKAPHVGTLGRYLAEDRRAGDRRERVAEVRI